MIPRDRELSIMVGRALKEATPTLGDLAARLTSRKRETGGEDTGGVSYDAVRSWSIGRSSPNPEHRALLAEILDEQADRLRGLAADLREREAGEG